jgi:drug/metabolite transporter (DMT)-like permease
MSARRAPLPIGILAALAAAALFGASTPVAKTLLASVSPWMLASLLYLGSGIGLSTCALLLRRGDRSAKEAPLVKRDLPWLAGAVLAGGVLGPVLLMYGLRVTAASTSALLLNLESVLTAAIAWLVLRENVDRRVFLGMVAIVAGGALLSWAPAAGASSWLGTLAIAGACLCWAIDNNLTRAVSGGDPMQVAAIKGWVAGITNLGLALALGQRWPDAPTLALSMLVGFAGYGLSLVLFVRALRDLGAARTGAYFSTAPFVGAALAVLWLAETPTTAFWIAGALMALGVWLHLSERHEHEHAHEAIAHEHAHVHDSHHQHAHDFDWDGSEPHSHAHRHEPMRHSHPHFPDLHHRHDHG